MNVDHRPMLSYHIRVGHLEFHLKAHDAAEAIELTRRQLSRDLPRLYDLIRNLTTTRFQVESAA
jgi:hypothetical protein